MDFNYLGTKKYHNSFHLWEDTEKEYLLSDLVEIHFIELPKFRKMYEKHSDNIALDRWLLFLQQDVSKEKLEELVEMDLGIKMAEKKLERLSSDPETIALYQAREDAAHERANLISTGVQQGINEVAINLLDILDNEMISKKTGLPLETVIELRKKYHSYE